MTFNQNIGNWDVSNVTTMSQMFYGDAGDNAFNNGSSSSISGWNTSSLTNIQEMLRRCTSFDQPLTNWVVTGITNATNFMNSVTLSTCNYDRTLSGWHSQAVQNGVNIHFGGSEYSSGSLPFRNALVASGWTITDGGMASTQCSELYTEGGGEGIGGGGGGGDGGGGGGDGGGGMGGGGFP